MREFDRVLSDLERSPRKVLLAAPIRDVLSRLPRAQRDRVTGVLSEDAPIGSLRGSGPFDALIVRDQMAMLKALERWVREAATATGELRAGLPKDELLRWATEAGVRDLLDLPVRMLVDPRGAWTYGDRAVSDALLEAPASGSRETVLERVQVALCDRLRSAAAAVEQGRIDERSLPTVPPADARLSSLWMALVAVRAGLRAEVEPSGGVDAEARLDPAKSGLVLTTWRPCPRTGALAGSVALGLRGAPSLSCGCGRRDGRCGLGLAVVDQTLRGLHGALGPKVADWLAEPMWVDRLRKLDAVLAPRSATATLGWRVDLAREVVIRPVTCTSHGIVPAVRGAVEAHDERDRELLMLTARDDGDAVFTALRRLAGHPRVFVEGAPVEVALGAIGLRLVPTMFGARLVVLIDGAPAGAGALDGAIRVGPHGLVLRRGQRLVAYAAGASLRALVNDLRESGDTFRTDALPALMERWPQIAAVAPADVDPELVGGTIPMVGEVIVVLATRGQGLAVDVRMRVGATSFAPGEGEDRTWQVVDGRLVQGLRDLVAERAAADEVCARLALAAPSVVIVDPDAAWTLLDTLREGFTVVWTGPRRRALATPRPADLRLNVGTADRWLAVGGDVDLDGRTVPLAELVASLRERRGTVVVGDDLVRLAGPLVDHLRALDAIATTSPDGRWLVPGAAAAVLGELASEAVIEGDAPFRLALDRWRATLVDEPALPVGFVADLRDYQLAGFRFLARLAAWSTGGLLCDDMGLGKTVQALGLLVSRAAVGPQLVIAPTSVMTNWVREGARFAPGLEVVVHHGASRDVGAPGPGTVLVTSWDLLVRDEEALRSVQFATVVFDEAQATKNATTRRAKSARALSAAFRVVLTGTPLENRLSDLWSLVDLAVPGLLGDSRSFRDRFATPIERNADEGARQALGRLLAPFLLRRTKSAVASELPARSEVIVPIDLDAAGRAVYDQWRTAALRDLGRRDLPAQNQRVLVLAALTALRQTACSAHLVDKSRPRTSAKLERLREIITELREQGHQALVFSQFVSLLGIVREMLAADGVKLRYLDGSTPAAVRQEEVDRFQAGDGDVFLISLKAGGTGLNLTAATYVIHLDPWWNPAVEDQASDRAHRIGQNRPVTVYKLVARGTVEEAIVALQGEKRALVDGVLGDAGKAASLPLDELVALLSYGESAGG